ncbi:MAG: hypothetical protein ACPLPW_08820, partial [bacterium]
YMYRASVLGGEAGTWKDALDYFGGSVIEIGYDYVLNFKMDHGEFYGLIDLTDTLVSPYVGTRSKILEAALFFEGMEAAKIFPEEDEFNCCANFVSLVLRMAAVFGKDENYSSIYDINDEGPTHLQYNLGKKGWRRWGTRDRLPGDIVIFDMGEGHHHTGIYLWDSKFIGSNNQIINGKLGPQIIDIQNLLSNVEGYWGQY